MANHKSATKRAVSSEKKRLVNKSKLSRVRTMVKKAEVAIKAGDKTSAATAVKVAESALAKGAQAHIMTKKSAARKTSKLAQKMKTI